MVKYDIPIIELFEKGYIDYDFWGTLDILIDGQSFFHKFKLNNYDKYYEGTSSISNKGITTPIFPMLEAILKAIVNLNGENETVVIEEYTGQISKSIVLAESDDNKIIIAIRDGFISNEYTWYDGKKVSVQKEIPVSKNNILKKEDVIKGCIESVRKYLLYLVYKYPNLKEIPHFRKLAKSVGL
jgi:hypothetical protein